MQTRNEKLLMISTKTLKERMGEIEKEIILETLEAAGNNQSLTARLLKISRTALRYKIAEYERKINA